MKKEFVEKYNIILNEINSQNPLTIGNGNIAFSSDITGLQTLSSLYTSIPLLTMTNKIWIPLSVTGQLKGKEYKRRNGKSIYYMTDEMENPSLYDSLRKHQHKFNFFNLAFVNDEGKLNESDITPIEQKLDLYTGVLQSNFLYRGEMVKVRSSCDNQKDVLNFEIESDALLDGLKISFSAMEPSYELEGSTDEYAKISYSKDILEIENTKIKYKLFYKANVHPKLNGNYLNFSDSKHISLTIGLSPDSYQDNMITFWNDIKEFDTGDEVLNERLVKSLYLLKINCCGIYPPAETGLTCNSWYGKFHLEMHLIHLLGFIKMGGGKYVLPSIEYYLSIFTLAKERASSQGYAGARWPKMTDPTGYDSPSIIGCLLVWQQPHIIFLLEALLNENPNLTNYERFGDLLKNTIDFICSYFVKQETVYVLDKPMIPAQECHSPEDSDSPFFEVEYLREALLVGKKLAQKLHFSFNPLGNDIIEHAIKPRIEDGCYTAHQSCTETYTKYNHDHPMVLFAYSYFKSSRVNDIIMSNTYQAIKKSYNLDSLWGWDFPFMAMCANHLGDRGEAIKMLKFTASKNEYLLNGHNKQGDREDLPLYLPGNGAYVLAIYEIFK